MANDYISRLIAVESGGNPNAQNSRSSARGLGQFTRSTGAKYGITDENWRDPNVQRSALAQFTEDNARALQNAGVPVNDGTLYMAHYAGVGGAIKAFKNPNAPIPAAVQQANPNLRGKTYGDWYGIAANKITNGGKNQPSVFYAGNNPYQMFPEGRGDRRLFKDIESMNPQDRNSAFMALAAYGDSDNDGTAKYTPKREENVWKELGSRMMDGDSGRIIPIKRSGNTINA